METESTLVIWLMVLAISFIIMIVMLMIVTILLIANFNTMRRMRQETRIYLKVAYHSANMNEFLVRILARYERNLAIWHNDATGRQWEIQPKDKTVYESIKQEIHILKSNLEEERDRIQNR